MTIALPADSMTPERPLLQRSRGELRLAASVGAHGGSKLVRRFQSGCARVHTPPTMGGHLQAVMINTAGGITDGDVFTNDISAGLHADLTVTSQAAEKVYRAASNSDLTADIDSSIQIAPGARVDWLPQPAILFDACRARRRTRVDLSETSAFTGVEAAVLGRTAMGEAVKTLYFEDRWEIIRDGRLIYLDPLRLSGRALAEGSAAVLGPLRAWANIIVQRDAESLASLRDRVRGAFDPLTAKAGASIVSGLLCIRLAAADGLALTRALTTLIPMLTGREIPRPWLV